MSMTQPEIPEPAPGAPVTADWARRIARSMRSMRLSGGPGVRVSTTPSGTTVSATAARHPSADPNARPRYPFELGITEKPNGDLRLSLWTTGLKVCVNGVEADLANQSQIGNGWATIADPLPEEDEIVYLYVYYSGDRGAMRAKVGLSDFEDEELASDDIVVAKLRIGKFTAADEAAGTKPSVENYVFGNVSFDPVLGDADVGASAWRTVSVSGGIAGISIAESEDAWPAQSDQSSYALLCMRRVSGGGYEIHTVPLPATRSLEVVTGVDFDNGTVTRQTIRYIP